MGDVQGEPEAVVADVPAAGEQQQEPTPGEGAPKLSKNQMRKQLRAERWEQGREQRKQKRKDKKEVRRQRRAQEVAEAAAKGEPLPAPATSAPKRRKIENEADQPPPDMTVVVDCSFDELMNDKEISSLARQIETVYSVNRRSTHPFNVSVTSFGGKLRKRFETYLEARDRWRLVTFSEEPLIEKFSKESIVYLSSESTNVLTELEAGKVYVIGGLVDHNRHKGLCFERATQMGIPTAQLPIGEHMRMSTRKVLAVNHVFEILAKVREGNDWAQALATTIPLRKNFSLIGGGEANEGQGEAEGEIEGDGKDDSDAEGDQDEVDGEDDGQSSD